MAYNRIYRPAGRIDADPALPGASGAPIIAAAGEVARRLLTSLPNPSATNAMRPDRMFTLGIARPLLRASVFLRGQAHASVGGPRILPILMYHSIAGEAEAQVAPYFRVSTSPARFRDQIAWLESRGWIGVTVSRGLDWQAGKWDSAKKPVAITFDDGFRDFLTDAFPVLSQHGFHATMNLPTGVINGRDRFKEREYLNWGEIRELHRAGIEFGSHTVSHPVLYELSWTEIETELSASKTCIENELGEPVPLFSYPYAYPKTDRKFTKSFEAVLRNCGYFSCVTTTVGRAWPTDDRLALRRLPVNDCDDLRLLAAKLEGAYDWVATPQSLLKTCRNFGLRSKRK